MAHKANDFTPHYTALESTLVDLNHYRHFIEIQLSGARQAIERLIQVQSQKGNSIPVLTGTALPVIDLFSTSEWITRAPAGVRTTSPSDAIAMSSEMERRFNAFILVSAFERLEHYLRLVYGTMLNRLRDAIKLDEVEQFHDAQRNVKSERGTPRYFQKYADYVCRRNCNKALQAFEQQLADRPVVLDRYWGMQLIELIRVIGFCRNCVVHQEGHVADDAVERLTKPQRSFVSQYLSDTLLDKEKVLLPSSAQTKDLLEIIVSCAHALYVQVSNRCGLPIDRQLFT